MRQSIAMTFDEWKATRECVHRSNSRYRRYFEDWNVDAQEMFVYGLNGDNMLGYIEINKGYNVIYGTGKLHEFDMYYLNLENRDWFVTRDGLLKLEQELYTFFKDEGAFEESPHDMRMRLVDITSLAMAAFWKVVAERYPECKSGDLGPAASTEFEQAAYKVVTTWRDNNGGGQNVNK